MFNYDGRRFRSDAEGDGDAALATYHQSGNLLWGEFVGGRAHRGSLNGNCAPDGCLEFGYSMVLDDAIVVGHCWSTPEVLTDGRIRLRERWRRFAPEPSSGVSFLEEVTESNTGEA